MSETDKTFYSIGCYKTILINAQLISELGTPNSLHHYTDFKQLKSKFIHSINWANFWQLFYGALNGSKQVFCIDENLLSAVCSWRWHIVALIFNIVKPDLQKISSNSSLSKESRYFTPTVLLSIYYIHYLYINQQNINSYFKFIPAIMINIQLFIFKTVYTDWNWLYILIML